MNDHLFMGKNGFIWWFGRVENNADPKGLGRCKVRIDGWHNPDDTVLSTDSLPWAYPITPITNAGIAGIGTSITGPQINTRVVGWFADGEAGQQPIMFGVVGGINTNQTLRPLPYGAPPQQPNMDKLFGTCVISREGDCPDGTDGTTTSLDVEIPDPRNIKINPSEWQCPITGFVSSAYGERSGLHHGVDICPAGFFEQTDSGADHLNGRLRGPTGLPIHAAAAGTVIHTFHHNIGQGGRPTSYDIDGHGSRSYGNAIVIKHTLSTGTFTTIYAHLGSNQDPSKDGAFDGILVREGDTVLKGQVIGTLGRTHNWDTPTHLHFECRLGSGLPKADNHFNPGIIFPQMSHRHTTYLSWLNSYKLYNSIIPYSPDDAPIIRGTGPA